MAVMMCQVCGCDLPGSMRCLRCKALHTIDEYKIVIDKNDALTKKAVKNIYGVEI